MIFVTVGTQLSFDRLILAMDAWAGTVDESIVAQIGPTDLKPQNMVFHQFLSPNQFSDYMEEASVVIAHAGMGSILTAMQIQKPIVIMPRKACLGEHRNEHQIATVGHFKSVDGIYVVMNENELVELLRNANFFSASGGVGLDAQDELINAVKEFVKD